MRPAARHAGSLLPSLEPRLASRGSAQPPSCVPGRRPSSPRAALAAGLLAARPARLARRRAAAERLHDLGQLVDALHQRLDVLAGRHAEPGQRARRRDPRRPARACPRCVASGMPSAALVTLPVTSPILSRSVPGATLDAGAFLHQRVEHLAAFCPAPWRTRPGRRARSAGPNRGSLRRIALPSDLPSASALSFLTMMILLFDR